MSSETARKLALNTLRFGQFNSYLKAKRPQSANGTTSNLITNH